MCSICRQYPCSPRCPNHMPLKTKHYCSICNEGIFNGEEYVENMEGEYGHYDCLMDLSCLEMIEWLSGKIKTMEDDYGEYY